jgi:hypothetical protein
MQVRNQRRTLQYPRRAVLRQMLGQGSGPQEKDDGTAGDGTVGKYGPPFRIANQRDKSNDNKIKQLNTYNSYDTQMDKKTSRTDRARSY